MPTAVRPRISSSYSSSSASSRQSSQFFSESRQPETPLKSSLPGRRSDRVKAVSLPQPNDRVQLPPQRHRDESQVMGETPVCSNTPTWLKVLIAVQRGSTPITFFLVVGVLVVYGWSVYTQRSWSKAYRQFAQLQREERQLTATSEARKYQLAQQAESSKAGLVRRDPANVIFLEPEPLRSLPANSNQSTKEFTPISPVGY